jgi:hypothetical protein
MIDGRLDYCNSMLYRASLADINKLQRVQNSAERIAAKSIRSDHINACVCRATLAIKQVPNLVQDSSYSIQDADHAKAKLFNQSRSVPHSDKLTAVQ